MTFIVATNVVVASLPPECRPTGTPHVCAKNQDTTREIDIKRPILVYNCNLVPHLYVGNQEAKFWCMDKKHREKDFHIELVPT